MPSNWMDELDDPPNFPWDDSKFPDGHSLKAPENKIINLVQNLTPFSKTYPSQLDFLGFSNF